MTGGIEAVGSLVEGGMLARAIEPRAGEADGHTHEGACLNCSTALVGPHCHQCGQRGHVHRTLGAFFHDLLHGVFHFEGKIWRTLPMLAWRPGQLTREYIEGRRANYVSPIALFLFVVFITFALFSLLGSSVHVGDGISVDATTSLSRAKADIDNRIGDLEQKRGLGTANGRSVTDVDAELAKLHEDRAALQQIKLPNTGPTVTGNGAAGEAVARGLNAAWIKAKQNPALLIYKLQSSAYKFSWLLIPISVPFLWLLFPFSRRYRLYDHMVFVTYSISFMLMLIAVISLGGYFRLKWLVVVPLLYMPFHMYRQLKGAYALGRLSALWRTAAMLMFAGIALTLWGLAILSLILGE